jgi:hypothetical protein
MGKGKTDCNQRHNVSTTRELYTFFSSSFLPTFCPSSVFQYFLYEAFSCNSTMTEETAAAVSKVVPSPFLADDPLFDFNTTEWVVPPHLIAHKDVHSTELKRRQQQEHVYRSKIKHPTLWHRYLVLGRYAMSGPAFDMLMNNPAEQDLKIHSVIW